MFNFVKKLCSPKINILSNQAPLYNIADILKNENEQYTAIIRINGKKECFRMKPEEILADNELTQCFHQFDIRLLTYLGYCGINTPQYKILAKKILTNENIDFALYDKEKNSYSIISSRDIAIGDEELIANLNSKDAYELGFSHGRNSILEEKRLIKKSLEKDDGNLTHD
jgi:hypothetical protein